VQHSSIRGILAFCLQFLYCQAFCQVTLSSGAGHLCTDLVLTRSAATHCHDSHLCHYVGRGDLDKDGLVSIKPRPYIQHSVAPGCRYCLHIRTDMVLKRGAAGILGGHPRFDSGREEAAASSPAYSQAFPHPNTELMLIRRKGPPNTSPA
jgi:hypothetical protein